MPEEEVQSLDVVLVIKRVAENGSISAEVVTNGNVLATEVQTLIELGLKNWREQIGLSYGR